MFTQLYSNENLQHVKTFIIMCFYFGTDPSLMPYMSDDGMSEDSSVVGMPHGKV